MNDDVIIVERDGAVGMLTIDREAARNSMNELFIKQLKDALLGFDGDDGIGAIVLQGVAPGFCAGSDLKYLSKCSVEQIGRFEQETGDVARLMGFIKKPVVAAVEGFAIGGGFILAASCDIVVTGRTAKWNLPEVRIGWLTPWGLKFLVERVGNVTARNLCFGLDMLDGNDAFRLGVADYVVEDGTVLQEALSIARKIADLPRDATAATKRFFSNYILNSAEAMDFEANRLFLQNCGSETAKSTLGKK